MSLTDYTDFTDKNDNRLGIDLLRAEGGGRRAEGGEKKWFTQISLIPQIKKIIGRG